MDLEDIRANRPCIDGWKKLIRALDRTTGPITLGQVYESNGYVDALWCLRCIPFEEYKLWLVETVETVLPIFEAAYPNDKRPKAALEAIKSDSVTDEIIAATDAASRSADNANFSVYAASRAAHAAVDAARAADATYAGHSTVDAAYAAFDAIYIASYTVGVGKEVIEKIFIKHFVETN